MTADLALQRFVAWSPRILAAFAASACVETTRFLIEVLKRLEIDARPLPVKFLATCHAAGYQFVSGASDAEMATAKRICRGVTDRGGGGWNGHLLAVVDGRFLVETAFAQVSAPEYGVILEPSALVIPIPEPPSKFAEIELVAEIDQWVFNLKYFGTDDQSFREAPAWEPSHLLAGAAILADRIRRGDEPPAAPVFAHEA